MKPTNRQRWRFLIYLLRHKYYVLIYGLKLGGIPFSRLFFHDSDKLSTNFDHFALHYAGIKGKAQEYALKTHIYAHPHHYEGWFGERMDDPSRREMLVDWQAANKAKRSPFTVAEFYLSKVDHTVIHPETLRWLEQQLGV